jgi:hypothetical protein
MRFSFILAMSMLGCGGAGGSSAAARPFGAYGGMTTTPTCKPSETPFGGTIELVFQNSSGCDGGAPAVTSGNVACTSSWQDEKVVVTCGRSTLDLTYDLRAETLSGAALDVCECGLDPMGMSAYPVDCSVTMAKK